MNQFGLQFAKGFVANNILALHLKGAEKLLKNQYTVIVQSKRGPLLCFQLVVCYCCSFEVNPTEYLDSLFFG